MLHCLEVDQFHDSRLVVLSEVRQVGIATNDVVSTDGVSQSEEIEVFGVTDGCRDYLGLDGNELTIGIDDGQQVIKVDIADVFADFVAAGHVTDFLDELATDVHVETRIGQHPTHELRLMADEERNP